MDLCQSLAVATRPAQAMTLGIDANATHIVLTVEKDGKVAAQSRSSRVQSPDAND